MITETYTLPAHWACALINDDTSGMDYRDEKPFHDFCEYMVKEYGTIMMPANSAYCLVKCSTTLLT